MPLSPPVLDLGIHESPNASVDRSSETSKAIDLAQNALSLICTCFQIFLGASKGVERVPKFTELTLDVRGIDFQFDFYRPQSA